MWGVVALPYRKSGFPIQIRVWDDRSDFMEVCFQIVAESLIIVFPEYGRPIVSVRPIGPHEVGNFLVLHLVDDFARHFAWRDDAGAELKHARRAFLTGKEIEAGVFRN